MKIRALLLAAAGAALALPAAHAQPAGRGTVSGQGTAEIRRPADVLRVQVDVLARGKDLKEALARLKERRAAAEAQLAKLGATRDALVFGEPALSSEKNDRQMQVEMMMRGRMGRAGKKPDAKPKQAPAVVVACPLKVEFALKAASADELLVAVTELQEKVKAADLGGLKELKQPAAEEENSEEAAEMAMMVGNDGQPPRGEPVFLFVGKITEAERAKALAEAFQKAKHDAGRLARAAGMEVEALLSLTDSSQPAFDMDENYQTMAYYGMIRYARQAGHDQSATEAIAVQPGKTALRVTVTASFSLKPAAK